MIRWGDRWPQIDAYLSLSESLQALYEACSATVVVREIDALGRFDHACAEIVIAPRDPQAMALTFLHELRHCWQSSFLPQTGDLLPSSAHLRERVAEADAEVFTALVCVELHRGGLTNLFDYQCAASDENSYSHLYEGFCRNGDVNLSDLFGFFDGWAYTAQASDYRTKRFQFFDAYLEQDPACRKELRELAPSSLHAVGDVGRYGNYLAGLSFIDVKSALRECGFGESDIRRIEGCDNMCRNAEFKKPFSVEDTVNSLTRHFQRQ